MRLQLGNAKQSGKFDLGYRATDKMFSTNCLNSNCAFSEELPIYFVDDKIYQNPPTLLFATVDKFAMLSHRQEGHRLFNSVLEEDDKNKQPPDLIIQDELHLLSGPLGSITGLYESIVELLATKGNKKPKIITSTATTRNTEQQVAMLYGNRKLNIFPPMGVTYDDNFSLTSQLKVNENILALCQQEKQPLILKYGFWEICF